MTDQSADRKHRLQLRYQLDLNDYELLLYECGLPLRDQIRIFGCRLSERDQPLSLGEFQVLLEWLQQQGHIDADYAAMAESSFYRLALKERSSSSANIA